MTNEAKSTPYNDQIHAEQVAERLKTLRNRLGYSAKDFAEGAGLNPKQYNHWETGVARISINGAMRLQERYGISLDFIYLGRLDTLSNKIAKAFLSKPDESATKVSTESPEI